MNRQKLVTGLLVVMLLLGGWQYYRAAQQISRYEEDLLRTVDTGLKAVRYFLRWALEEEEPAVRNALVRAAVDQGISPVYVLSEFRVLSNDPRQLDILYYWVMNRNTATSFSVKNPETDAELKTWEDRVYKLIIALNEEGPTGGFVSLKKLRARVEQLVVELGLREMYPLGK